MQQEYKFSTHTLMVDYDRPTSGFRNDVDRDKEVDGIDAANAAAKKAIVENPEIDNDELTDVVTRAFDKVVGTADTGGYTVSARRV